LANWHSANAKVPIESDSDRWRMCEVCEQQKMVEDKKENRKQLKHCEGYNIFGFPQGERYPRYPVIFRELNMLRPFRKRRNNYTSIRGVTAPKQLEHINASQE